MLANIAHVADLPLVPATSTTRSCRSGPPARSSSARVRPSFHCSAGLARGFQPTPRSWSARLNSQLSARSSDILVNVVQYALAVDFAGLASLEHLRHTIRDYGSALTAFSAGVDSTLVAVVGQPEPPDPPPAPPPR